MIGGIIIFRIDAIIKHDIFTSYMEKNKQKEENRKFCKHNLQHSLDVARIAYILCLEANLNIEKEIIYATALLHDITKWIQYENEIPHNESIVIPAKKILTDCGFHNAEIKLILDAMQKHREHQDDKTTLSGILYYADKKSRMCFECAATEACNWSNDKKNASIIY